MKTKKLLPLLTVLLTLAACGGDGDDIIVQHNTQKSGNTVVNNNRNLIGPLEAQTRYEFPKLQGGNSEAIIHSTVTYGMNYALEWDHQKRATRWVCWRMDATNRQERYSRPAEDPWAYDPLVPENEQQATYSELSKSYYPETNSYYQKGHICASQDRIYDKEANYQTFYMTNIMPQVGNFNEKIWLELEKQVRTWGKTCDTLYICKGGTIDRADYIINYTIGNHIVPQDFFVELLRKSFNDINAIAFWMPHLDEDHSRDPLRGYAIKVDRLEELTGIDFFCNLPDDIEDMVESKMTPSEWGLK